jgi:hypothetical protein
MDLKFEIWFFIHKMKYKFQNPFDGGFFDKELNYRYYKQQKGGEGMAQTFRQSVEELFPFCVNNSKRRCASIKQNKNACRECWHEGDEDRLSYGNKENYYKNNSKKV